MVDVDGAVAVDIVWYWLNGVSIKDSQVCETGCPAARLLGTKKRTRRRGDQSSTHCVYSTSSIVSSKGGSESLPPFPSARVISDMTLYTMFRGCPFAPPFAGLFAASSAVRGQTSPSSDIVPSLLPSTNSRRDRTEKRTRLPMRTVRTRCSLARVHMVRTPTPIISAATSAETPIRSIALRSGCAGFGGMVMREGVLAGIVIMVMMIFSG